MLYVILLLTVITNDQVHSYICEDTYPCKTNFITHYNDRPTAFDEDDECDCSNATCPRDWSSQNNRLKIIKLKMFNTINNVTMDFMFCESVLSQKETCTHGSTAVEMYGELFPEFIKRINCKCPDNNPLFYKMVTRLAAISIHYISYICDSHKIICEGLNHICFDGVLKSFPCQCPSGFKCSSQLGEGIGRCIAI